MWKTQLNCTLDPRLFSLCSSLEWKARLRVLSSHERRGWWTHKHTSTQGIRNISKCNTHSLHTQQNPYECLILFTSLSHWPYLHLLALLSNLCLKGDAVDASSSSSSSSSSSHCMLLVVAKYLSRSLAFLVVNCTGDQVFSSLDWRLRDLLLHMKIWVNLQKSLSLLK